MPAFQTIATKHHGTTNKRGPRITATSSSGLRVSVPYDHELSDDQNHVEAARTLICKLGWYGHGPWFGGHTRDGMVFVCRSNLTIGDKA